MFLIQFILDEYANNLSDYMLKINQAHPPIGMGHFIIYQPGTIYLVA